MLEPYNKIHDRNIFTLEIENSKDYLKDWSLIFLVNLLKLTMSSLFI